MSRVRDVEVRGGVVEGQVELGAGGAEGHVAGVEMVEPGPGLVGSVDCRAFANLLKILRRARVEMRMMMMTIVVVTALGSCKFCCLCWRWFARVSRGVDMEARRLPQ